MQITPETVKKIAHLSRLELTPAEEADMADTLGKIVSWMEQLNEVPTEGVEPLTHMTLEVNNYREDVSEQTLSRSEALFNAPAKTDAYFTVPKVIE